MTSDKKKAINQQSLHDVKENRRSLNTCQTYFYLYAYIQDFLRPSIYSQNQSNKESDAHVVHHFLLLSAQFLKQPFPVIDDTPLPDPERQRLLQRQSVPVAHFCSRTQISLCHRHASIHLQSDYLVQHSSLIRDVKSLFMVKPIRLVMVTFVFSVLILFAMDMILDFCF